MLANSDRRERRELYRHAGDVYRVSDEHGTGTGPPGHDVPLGNFTRLVGIMGGLSGSFSSSRSSPHVADPGFSAPHQSLSPAAIDGRRIIHPSRRPSISYFPTQKSGFSDHRRNLRARRRTPWSAITPSRRQGPRGRMTPVIIPHRTTRLPGNLCFRRCIAVATRRFYQKHLLRRQSYQDRPIYRRRGNKLPLTVIVGSPTADAVASASPLRTPRPASNPHRRQTARPPPAGSSLGGLSDAGLQYGGYVTMGRHPKPFTIPVLQPSGPTFPKRTCWSERPVTQVGGRPAVHSPRFEWRGRAISRHRPRRVVAEQAAAKITPP